MILEDLEDRDPASYPTVVASLKAIVFNARELVRFVQNALPPDQSNVSGTDLKDLQFWLRSHVIQLLEDAGDLGDHAPPEFRDDTVRIRQAAERLLRFTEGHPEALDDGGPFVSMESAAVHRGTKGCILIVDDNAGNRDILRRILEREGYAATVAQDGESALKLAESNAFDLVLLDVVMPTLSGFEVLQRMKSSFEREHTPVIMISALDEGSSVIRCIEMGAEDYFMKPFDPVLLRTRIGAALKKTRLLKGLDQLHAIIHRPNQALEQQLEDARRVLDALRG